MITQIKRKFTTVAIIDDGVKHPEDITIWIEYTDTNSGKIIQKMKDKSCCLLSGHDPKVIKISPSSFDWKEFFSVTSKDGIITVRTIHSLDTCEKMWLPPLVIGEKEVNFPD